MRMDVTRPSTEELLLKPRNALADGCLDFALGLHGQAPAWRRVSILDTASASG